MLNLLIFALLAYVAWRYYGWRGAEVVAAAYVIVSIAWWLVARISASAARQEAARHASLKLSEAEKAHLAATREHQQAMLDHKAQFDPDLRKRGP